MSRRRVWPAVLLLSSLPLIPQAFAQDDPPPEEPVPPTEGEQQEHTDWHRIVAWKGLAEICGDHLKKGSKVYIEGKMQTRKWEENGITRYTTEIIAKSMEMLGGRNFDQETDSSSAANGDHLRDNPPSPDTEVPF